MIHPLAKYVALVLTAIGVASAAAAVLSVFLGDDPLNLLAAPVILFGTVLAVALALLFGAVAQAVKGLSEKGDRPPSQ